MLCSLQIRNFAIVDHAEIEFDRGMTVLTGETGAGKSILVDALGLLLGERGGSGLVRAGAKRAELAAEFDLRGLDEAQEWLEENSLDADGVCLLRRVINADGRSRAFINGNAAPLQNLKSLGELLVDIHGQHFHQSLGHQGVQRDLLDHFGTLLDERAATEAAFRSFKELADETRALQEADADRAARIELLTFQTNELDALALEPGEFELLQAEQLRLRNSDRLAEGLNSSLAATFDAEEGNAHGLLADARRSLEGLIPFDDSLQPILDLLYEAGIQVSEAADALRRYSDKLEMDPERRDQVEERLDAILAIARKHRVDPEQLSDHLDRLSADLETLTAAEQRGAEFAEQTAAAAARYDAAAAQLSAGRTAAARRYSDSVSATMADLGMPGGMFCAEVAIRADREPRSAGNDEIQYMISANPGQPLMPLARVASGGELSRMSLAVLVIASDGSKIPTMIFDEVDSGVGGGVAEMVGLRLRELGTRRQVFCVTHLPQVASLADHHFRVVKISDGKTTRTSIKRLNDAERVEELARMLGGVEISQATRRHAAEMLQGGKRRAAE